MTELQEILALLAEFERTASNPQAAGAYRHAAQAIRQGEHRQAAVR